MSEAADFIADLDEELADRGQTITLRRLVTNEPPSEATARAIVSGVALDELVGDIDQIERDMILSPTGQTDAFAAEHIRRNDAVMISGRKFNVEMVEPVVIADTVVRFNCRVRG